MAEAVKYDRLQITFKNIFVGIQQNIHEPKWVDILAMVGISRLTCRGAEFSVGIGGSIKYTAIPRSETYIQDKLIFEFTNKSNFGSEEIAHIVGGLRQVITMFTKKPCDPIKVQVSIQQENGKYVDGTYELGTTGKYTSEEVGIHEALRVGETGNTFLRAAVAILERDVSVPVGQWFGYCESYTGDYYLDTIFSNLLSCAESVFYLLPARQSSNERGEQYDQMLTILREPHKTEVKRELIEWLEYRKRDYEDPKTYAEKIKQMMIYCGVDTKNSEAFRVYLNQIRNQLMHGLPRTWDTVNLKKDGVTNELPMNAIRSLRMLEDIVQKTFIKWLTKD